MQIRVFFNQAIMELGAVICLPRNPKCENCPVAKSCYAKNQNKIDVLPLKNKTTEKKIRYFHYLVITDENQIIINKRSQNDIWKSLYEFPLIESKEDLSIDKFFAMREIENVWKLQKRNLISISDIYVHKLTHQTIIAKFYRFKTKKIDKVENENFQTIELATIRTLPVSRLIEKYINTEFGFTK